jgi:hypothetical protein
LAISGSIVKDFTFLKDISYEWVTQSEPLLEFLRPIYDKISGQPIPDERIQLTDSVNAKFRNIALDDK